MNKCIFCKIIKGEIPCYKIYEDEKTLAFLDISNDIEGHTLVIPKMHVRNILDCSASVFAHVMAAVQKISQHYVDDCGFDGVNILNANEPSAEQSVFHLHMHILPRKSGDNVKVFPKLDGSNQSLDSVCEKLKWRDENVKSVTLYTDGACSGNPGIGGYCAILNYNGQEKIVSGGEQLTTNNRMELMGVIQGLEKIKEGCHVDVYSDSAYVVNAFLQDWISGWQQNGWHTKGKGEVLNSDLWKRLLVQVGRHHIEWHKVKGHSTNEINNRCDEIARGEIDKIKKNLSE